jgi:hypothetical protein
VFYGDVNLEVDAITGDNEFRGAAIRRGVWSSWPRATSRAGGGGPSEEDAEAVNSNESESNLEMVVQDAWRS